MNYTLNQLRIFLKVAETRSVTKTAEALHMTQPAVSIQLKNFQDQFDVPLTEVVGRQLYVTDFGEEIAGAAKRIMEEVDAIHYRTMAFKGELTGKLKISVVSTGKYVMPYFLADFLAINPGVTLMMDVTNKAKVIENLENNEVDFSLVSIVPEKPATEKIDLIQNKLFLVGGGEIPDEDQVFDKDLLKDLPLIYREEGSGTRQTMERFLTKNNIQVIKKMELTSNEAVKQAVLAGLGYSIMPLIGLKNELLNNDLQIIKIDGFPITSMWSLTWLKNKRHSPAAAALINYLIREKDNIVRKKFDWYEKY